MSELYALPEGWEWKKITDIASISNKTVNIDDDYLYNCVGLENIESNTGKLVDLTRSHALRGNAYRHLVWIAGCFLERVGVCIPTCNVGARVMHDGKTTVGWALAHLFTGRLCKRGVLFETSMIGGQLPTLRGSDR